MESCLKNLSVSMFQLPFVNVDPEKDEVTFKLQSGPVAENGINGGQLDNLILLATDLIRNLNAKFPCRENSIAITHLETALLWLEARTKDRINRGVEGHDKI